MAYVRKRTALPQDKTLDTKSSDKINPLSVVILSSTIIVSVSGILFSAMLKIILHQRSSIFCYTGPYSAQIQAKPFSDFLHLKPLLIFSILAGVAKSMYGIPLMVVSGLGVLTYIFSRRKNLGARLFYNANHSGPPSYIKFCSHAPRISRDIYPIEGGTASWYNGRYSVRNVCAIDCFLFGFTCRCHHISNGKKSRKVTNRYFISIFLIEL